MSMNTGIQSGFQPGYPSGFQPGSPRMRGSNGMGAGTGTSAGEAIGGRLSDYNNHSGRFASSSAAQDRLATPTTSQRGFSRPAPSQSAAAAPNYRATQEAVIREQGTQNTPASSPSLDQFRQAVRQRMANPPAPQNLASAPPATAPQRPAMAAPPSAPPAAPPTMPLTRPSAMPRPAQQGFRPEVSGFTPGLDAQTPASTQVSTQAAGIQSAGRVAPKHRYANVGEPVTSRHLAPPPALEMPVASAPVGNRPDQRPSRTNEIPLNYLEVHQIARDAGFVGVSDKDIRRAYVYGESLLADYKV